jgi:hypothetical protein
MRTVQWESCYLNIFSASPGCGFARASDVVFAEGKKRGRDSDMRLEARGVISYLKLFVGRPCSTLGSAFLEQMLCLCCDERENLMNLSHQNALDRYSSSAGI